MPTPSFAAKTTDTMNTMRKPWVYRRKNIKGWWCGWYEGGKRRAKALPSKTLAEHFRNMKYAQLNSDVFTGIVDSDWHQLVEEYRKAKQVDGLQEASIYETRLTLRHVERLVGACSSRQITQQVLDKFVLERGKEVGKNTLNKDIRNLGAFLNWAAKNRYVAPDLVVKRVKVQQKPVQALSPQQVKALITAARDCPTLRLRILLAVTTGLRRGDIQAMRITNDVYTNVDPALRQAISQLPVADWV